MKLLIMQFSLASCYFIPLRSKYSHEHPVLKHPQSMFLSECERPSVTPIQNCDCLWDLRFSRRCDYVPKENTSISLCNEIRCVFSAVWIESLNITFIIFMPQRGNYIVRYNFVLRASRAYETRVNMSDAARRHRKLFTRTWIERRLLNWVPCFWIYKIVLPLQHSELLNLYYSSECCNVPNTLGLN
jgi:hypothetical protein